MSYFVFFRWLVSGSGQFTSFGEERDNLSAIVYL